MYSQRIFFTLLFAILLSLSSCLLKNPTATSQVDEGLFLNTEVSGTLPPEEDPTIIRTRYVDIDFDQLDNAEVDQVLILNLFEDALYEFVVDSKTSNDDGSYSLIGNIKDVEHSNVAFVVGTGQLAANITLPDSIFQVRYAGDMVHAVHQIDQSGFPPEAEPIVTE